MKKGLLKSSFVIVTAILLFFSFCLFIHFTNKNVEHFLDSDKSSELVYGQLLSKENKLISNKWYFSTEIRLLSNPLIYSFFFKLTDCWHLVRVLSYVIIFLLLLLSYFLLCHVLRCTTFFCITGLLLIIPFSEPYFRFMLVAPDYSPFIFITFLALFLSELYLSNCSITKIKTRFILFFSVLLSFIAGLNGARQLLNYYVPAFVCSIVVYLSCYRKINNCPFSFSNAVKSVPTVKPLLYSTFVFLGALAGFLVNKFYLSKMFSFYSFDSFSFSKFNLNKLSDIITNLLTCFGYVQEKNVFSSAALYNLFCIVWFSIFIYAVFYALKNSSIVSPSYYRTSLFTLLAFLFNIACLLFTNILNEERYHIPLIILSMPVIAQFLCQYKWKLIPKKICVLLLVLLTSINIFRYRSLKDADETAELRYISQILVKENYLNGYATFWNANITTELSNGLIEVWSFGNEKLGIYQWLQVTSHSYTYPKNKTFIIVSPNELQQFNFTDKLSPVNQIYMSDNYLVYGYDDYQSLFSDLKISH